MREAIRSSPDSLADRAAALVVAKDAQGLFAFVRDQIATLPPLTSATEKSMRWGAEATLRGGAGTPRERAELLASLLKQAGFQASVMSGSPTGELAGVGVPDKVYLRQVPRTFSPAAPPSNVGSSWVSALTGSDSAPPLQALDANGAQAKAIYDTLSPLLPSTASANNGAYYLFDVPVVALQQGGTTTYLNPLLPDATFGQPYASNLMPAPAADAVPTLEVTLAISRASDPEKQIPLVAATYGADQLIGRQLAAHFQPTAPIAALITQPLSDITAFVATLAVSGADLTAAERSMLTKTGALVTQTGDVVVQASDGTITCNGLPIGKSGGGSGAAPTNVASVGVTADATAFPQIELTVSALDASKKPVAGLGASAFQVTEEGAAVPFLLRDNGTAAPRVLFVLDTTGSQPAITSAWANAVAQAVFTAAPNFTAQVTVVDGTPPTADGYTLTSTSALASALTSAPGNPQSSLYTWIRNAVPTVPTLIVLCSDGNAEDPMLASLALAAVTGGPPVLAVTSSNTTPVPDSPVMDGLAKASGGKVVNAGNLSDPTLVTTALSQMVGGRVSAPYRLSYVAPTQGPSTRTVKVSAHASGSATYQVPAQPSPASAIAGVYLQLTLTVNDIGAPETYTRVLGGWVPGGDTANAALIAAAVADARNATLGSALISFEGGAPTLSTWLADALSWRLATEDASNAFAKNDVVGGMGALAEVPTCYPREAVAMHPALLAPPAGVVVYEESMRAVLFTVRPGPTPLHADILPFTRFVSASASSTIDLFHATLLASLRMAVAEGSAFQTSTASLLKGKPLVALQLGNVAPSDVPQVPAAQAGAFVNVLNQYSDWYRFVAKDGSTLAFWAVHASTGSCLGVLPDGTGGGSDPCSTYKNLASFIDIIALFSDILGVPVLSLWAEIGKLVALAGVETLLAFSDSPLSLVPDSQVAAIGCSIGAGLLGGFPVNGITEIEGLSTVATNLAQGAIVNVDVGSFRICQTNPCK